MYDIKDILARIQAGESPEAIANEFADAVNAAVKLNDEEIQKQKIAEEKAAKDAKLDACVQAMATAMSDYIAIAEPDLVSTLDIDDVIDIAEIRHALDAALGAAKLALNIAKTLEETPSPKASPKAAKTSDDAISQFLKNFGL
jgi:hypothetical protein